MERTNSLSVVKNLDTYKNILQENDPQQNKGNKIGLRGIVSKKKKRFNNNKYDLDLAYITDRIIAMGFPSENLEGIYRNPMKQVQSFLEEYHADSYKVYNLCSEREYDHSKFKHRVSHYGFDDHNPPKFELFKDIFEDIDKYMTQNDKNVVAIHCKAGKGRTGTVIAGYFLYKYKNIGVTAKEALDFFGERRTKDGKGVTIKSQIRYVNYLDKILETFPTFPSEISSPKVLKRLVICGDLGYDSKGNNHPVFDLTCFSEKIKFESKKETPFELKTAGEYSILSFNLEMNVNKDLFFQFYYDKKRTEKMCSFWLHTFFVKNTEAMGLDTLDGIKKTIKNFPKNFKIMIYFGESQQTIINTSTPIHNESKIEPITKTILSKSPPKMTGDRASAIPIKNTPLSTSPQNSSVLVSRQRKNVPQKSFDNIPLSHESYYYGSSPNDTSSRFTTNNTQPRVSISVICFSCREPISNTKAVKTDEHYFHKTCFVCSVCNNLLKAAFFVGGKLYCQNHSPNKTICYKCNKAIDRDHFTFQGKKVHMDCHTCNKCKMVLDPKNFYIVSDEPYCDSCSMLTVNDQTLDELLEEEQQENEFIKEKTVEKKKEIVNEIFATPINKPQTDDRKTNFVFEDPPPKPSIDHLPRGIALYSFKASHRDELSFNKGDVIVIVKNSVDRGWKVGFLESDTKAIMGNFPSNYVTLKK